MGNSYTANLGFHRSAVEIAMRPPAMPPGGDAGEEELTIVDQKSGLVFTIVKYKGKRKVVFDITVFYGVKVWKPEFVATLLG